MHRLLPQLWIRFLLAALLPLALLPISGARSQSHAQEAAETIRFEFAPVGGLVWIEEMEDETAYDYGDMAPPRSQLTKGISRMDYEAQDDGGWVVTKVTDSISMDFGEGPIDNPIADLTVGHAFLLRVDARGTAVAVDGCRELVRKLERQLDMAIWEKFQSTQSAATIEAGEIRLWNHRLRGVLGEEVRVGEVWRVVDERRIQGRPILVTGVVRFDGWTQIKGQRGFKVLYEFDTAKEKVEAIGDGFDREVDWRPEGSLAGPSNLVLHGSSIRVIQPETGQILYESVHVEYEAPMGKPEGPKAKIEMNSSYRYRLAESEEG